ncbi:MAG: hypothetical protein M1819_004524 [Sarea resinae]|nr:MAG: hypothetical protein M1819_004524 [Sarea resinae]
MVSGASFLALSPREFKPLDLIFSRIGSSVVFTRVGLQISLATILSLLWPSKLLLFIVPSALHIISYNVHLSTPLTSIALNNVLQSHGYTVLARQESITGYISVLESEENHFRLLRCDHSLLGGEWLQPPQGHEHTSKVREPVFAVFAMLEAVRLVELEWVGQTWDSADEMGSVGRASVPDIEKSALVVGLGIGTTPAALIAHGINTTIVEIDPVVYEFATKYFELPPNHIPVIEDATAYVDRARKNNVKSGRDYDYIIHDVFTGGAEPIELFTPEFLSGLRDLLKPNGVIAINYAGDILLPSARLVINTINHVFPFCRLFREHEAPPASAEESKSDFTNVVIFCIKDGSASSFGFRSPNEDDFLGSYARRHYLLPRFEVDRAQFVERDGDLLWKGTTETLKKWQTKSASGHWELMRQVIPAPVWENW